MKVMLWFAALYIFKYHPCIAREICTRHAVLEETAVVMKSTPKLIPVDADLTAQMEVVESLDEKMQVMKNIKEDLLEDTEYAPKMIFNNLVFQAINSTLPHARENCTDIAQGFDVLFARFGDVDFDTFRAAGKYMKVKYGVTELPIGAVPTQFGVTTLTGGWMDEKPTGLNASIIQLYKDENLLVVLDTAKMAIVLPKVNDANKVYQVLCTRPAKFVDMNEANFNYMNLILDQVVATVDKGEQRWKQKALEYKQKQKGHVSASNAVKLKLQPVKAVMDVFNGISKLGTEDFWESDTITTNFLQTLYDKSKKVFNGDIFKAQLTPKQEKVVETGLNLFGKAVKVASNIATFKGEKSTDKENVYVGKLEVETTSEKETFHLFKIRSLLVDNQILKERYLVRSGTMAFTTKDLQMFNGCKIVPISSALPSKPSTCKINPPSLEAQKCGRAIMESKPLTACDFEPSDEPIAIRTNCAKDTNAVVSTSKKMIVDLVCNRNHIGKFEIPKGTHKLSTGCAMKIGTHNFLHEDTNDTNQAPPTIIVAEEEFLEDGDTFDVVLVSTISVCGLVFVLNILNIVYIIRRCRKKPRRTNSIANVDIELQDRENLIKDLHEKRQKFSKEVARMKSNSRY